jgi:hypothetical protein
MMLRTIKWRVKQGNASTMRKTERHEPVPFSIKGDV